MIKYWLSAAILVVLFFPHAISAQNIDTVRPQVFRVAVNGKPMPFNQGKILALTIKEDGSVTILAQTTTDMLTTSMITLSIFKTTSGNGIRTIVT